MRLINTVSTHTGSVGEEIPALDPWFPDTDHLRQYQPSNRPSYQTELERLGEEVLIALGSLVVKGDGKVLITMQTVGDKRLVTLSTTEEQHFLISHEERFDQALDLE